MMNSETVYWQAGWSAGRARRLDDEGVARFQSNWFKAALLVEKPEDRKAAAEAFRRGYHEGAKG